MIKDYSQPIQMIISSIIDQNLQNIPSNSHLDYYEKVKKVYDDTINSINTFPLIQPPLDDQTKQQIEDIIMDSITQSDKQIDVFDDAEYHPWLEDAKGSGEINWIHRDCYYKFLIEIKQWSNATVYQSIDKTTDIILDHMGNPMQDAGFIKKGLVIGNVQSGKTANYTGLINKAIDVGYKFIIVLAGQQNDLRNQTQIRLDKEVVGYDTSSIKQNKSKMIWGVGKIPRHPRDVITLTVSGTDGDFRFDKLAHVIEDNPTPVLAVVKKNTTILEHLIKYIETNLKLAKDHRTRLKTPVLIIDDEVDQASVNTKKNLEDDPTAINRKIRMIVNMCSRVSYVGYTATPYANVLIRNDAENEKYGDDLFPKDFIVVLPTSNGYCRVNEFFGNDVNIDSDLIVEVNDAEELTDYFDDEDDESGDEFKIKAHDEVVSIPGSLEDAIDDFIVGSAVRRARGEITHNGMMVHIAAFKTPANTLTDLLEEYIGDLKQEFRFENDDAVIKYKWVWETRFKKTSEKRGHKDFWNEIEKQLTAVIELLEVKLLNGDSKDIVDYTNRSQSQIIAVGGNKLSRGITLEGLMTTYYLRDPKAYDTAMQMGRWFGYKKSYIDLCRIYSEMNLIANFVRIEDASNALREDIAVMNDKNLTPSQFGLKIRANPNLLPTSRNKMYGSRKIRLSFSDERQETLHFDLSKKENNKVDVINLIRTLDRDEQVEKEDDGRIAFRHVKAAPVLEFLDQFNDGDDEFGKKTDRLISYIRKMVSADELKDWTVVISSTSSSTQGTVELDHYSINKAYRTNTAGNGQRNSIRALSTPSDFKYFFSDPELREKYKKGYIKSDKKLKEYFTKEKALLSIYFFNIVDKDDSRKVLAEDVVGYAIWFPETDNPDAYSEFHVNDVFKQKLIEDAVNGE